MWEEISTAEIQAELRKLFVTNGSLQTPGMKEKFSPFLDAPVRSGEEQAAAKRMLCRLLGLVTQKRDPDRAGLEDGIRFQRDVEVRMFGNRVAAIVNVHTTC